MSSRFDPNNISSSSLRFKGSLRRTILFVLLPLVIIIILLMSGISYLGARSVIQNQVNSQLDANLDSLSDDFDKWIKTKLIRLDLAIRREFIRDALDKAIKTGEQSGTLYLEYRQTILDGLQEIAQSGSELLFNHFFVSLPDGTIIFASQPDLEGQKIAEYDFFKTLTSESGSMVVHVPGPLFHGDTVVISSVHFVDDHHSPEAFVFGVSSSLSMFNLIEDVTRLNPVAQSFLITHSNEFIRVDPYQNILVSEQPSKQQVDILLPLMEEDIRDSSEHQHQHVSLVSFDGTPTIANYSWLPSLNVGLVIEVPQEIAFGRLNSLGTYTIAVTLIFASLLVVGVAVASQRLIGPLGYLADMARQFSQGRWDQRIPVTGNNEISFLSHTFNQMADDLTELYRSLETQVMERTESLEKRSWQLEATAKVARQASAIRNLDELLTFSTHLISEHFSFYHVGIFLLDDVQKYAVLQAANSEGGQRMLDRNHRLGVGKTGVVGYAASTGLPRIALDVGSDPFFFDNPDLPGTRSELALPLKIRGQVIGVLDVQSLEPAAFEDSDVEVLQILADQVALAIENARLLEQSQDVINELQHAYRSQVRSSWKRWMANQFKAFHFDRVRISIATPDQIRANNAFITDHPEIQNIATGSILTIPITLRDQKLGSIILRRDRGERPWGQDDLNLVSDSIAQIAVALDNARLLDETRRRADNEHIISEITSRMRETLDTNTILKTTAEEIRKSMNLSEVSILLDGPVHPNNPEDTDSNGSGVKTA